jgi:hypothetical protein
MIRDVTNCYGGRAFGHRRRAHTFRRAVKKEYLGLNSSRLATS